MAILHLIDTSTGDTLKSFSSSPSPLTLGRGSRFSTDVHSLSSGQFRSEGTRVMSQKQASLSWDPALSTPLLMDLGSTNGTWIVPHGQSISLRLRQNDPYRIKSGDLITFGKQMLGPHGEPCEPLSLIAEITLDHQQSSSSSRRQPIPVIELADSDEDDSPSDSDDINLPPPPPPPPTQTQPQRKKGYGLSDELLLAESDSDAQMEVDLDDDIQVEVVEDDAQHELEETLPSSQSWNSLASKYRISSIINNTSAQPEEEVEEEVLSSSPPPPSSQPIPHESTSSYSLYSSPSFSSEDSISEDEAPNPIFTRSLSLSPSPGLADVEIEERHSELPHSQISQTSVLKEVKEKESTPAPSESLPSPPISPEQLPRLNFEDRVEILWRPRSEEDEDVLVEPREEEEPVGLTKDHRVGLQGQIQVDDEEEEEGEDIIINEICFNVQEGEGPLTNDNNATPNHSSPPYFLEFHNGLAQGDEEDEDGTSSHLPSPPAEEEEIFIGTPDEFYRYSKKGRRSVPDDSEEEEEEESENEDEEEDDLIVDASESESESENENMSGSESEEESEPEEEEIEPAGVNYARWVAAGVKDQEESEGEEESSIILDDDASSSSYAELVEQIPPSDDDDEEEASPSPSDSYSNNFFDEDQVQGQDDELLQEEEVGFVRSVSVISENAKGQLDEMILEVQKILDQEGFDGEDQVRVEENVGGGGGGEDEWEEDIVVGEGQLVEEDLPVFEGAAEEQDVFVVEEVVVEKRTLVTEEKEDIVVAGDVQEEIQVDIEVQDQATEIVFIEDSATPELPIATSIVDEAEPKVLFTSPAPSSVSFEVDIEEQEDTITNSSSTLINLEEPTRPLIPADMETQTRQISNKDFETQTFCPSSPPNPLKRSLPPSFDSLTETEILHNSKPVLVDVIEEKEMERMTEERPIKPLPSSRRIGKLRQASLFAAGLVVAVVGLSVLDGLAEF